MTTIDVYDEQRKEWRAFDMLPTPPSTPIVKCGNGLHQFRRTENACACKQFERAVLVAGKEL